MCAYDVANDRTTPTQFSMKGDLPSTCGYDADTRLTGHSEDARSYADSFARESPVIPILGPETNVAHGYDPAPRFKLTLGRMGVRYYDPRLGRWLSRDPMGESGGFNLYAYCGNDPVNRWDYLGMADGDGELLKSYIAAAKRTYSQFDSYVTLTNPLLLENKLAAAAIGEGMNAVGFDPMMLNSFGPVGTEVSGELTAAKAEVEVAGAELQAISKSPLLSALNSEGAASSNLVTGRSSSWAGSQRFDPIGLSGNQIDTAILKSIRRQSGATANPTGQIVATSDQVELILNKATYWQRNILATNPRFAGLSANKIGTAVHSAVAGKMRSLNVSDLVVNQRLYGTSQFVSRVTGRPYAFRIPDYRLGATILDIKPVGTPLSGPQVIDFMSFNNTSDVRFIFYEPW